MKIFCSILCLFIFFTAARSQRECGTRQRRPLVHHDTLRPMINRLMYTTPYPVRIFIHVFADNSGNNRASDDTTIMRQVNNMVNFYSPQNICFILVGIEQINNAALLDMDADAEEGDLAQYHVPDCINIYVHTNLFDSNGGLNGNAYDIPNNYLSVVKSALESTTNISTLAHEMGHCFGLIHTFQTHEVNNETIRERVLRSGACSNCTTEGDLLCDTNADWDLNESSINDITCQYEGNQLYDECSNMYLMETTNLMTYGRRSCRDHFTNGQGSRMRSFLTSTSFLVNCISENDLVISTNQTNSSGYHLYTARNQVSTNVTALFFSGSAKANFSATEVTISPGVSFSPGTSSGYVQIRAGTLCQ